MRAEVEIELEALKGDIVLVENYRSSKRPWEQGRVTDVNIHVGNPNGSRPLECRVRYKVVLSRESRNGGIVDLHVGQDKVQYVKTPNE